MNGTGGQPDQQSGGYPAMEPAGITISRIDLSWGQIWKLLVLGGGLISSAYASGWVFVPARNDDFQALKQVVEIIRAEQSQNRDSVKRLVEAVDNLSGLVKEVQDSPPRIIERLVQVPPKPTPKPAVRAVP